MIWKTKIDKSSIYGNNIQHNLKSEQKLLKIYTKENIFRILVGRLPKLSPFYWENKISKLFCPFHSSCRTYPNLKFIGNMKKWRFHLLCKENVYFFLLPAIAKYLENPFQHGYHYKNVIKYYSLLLIIVGYNSLNFFLFY